MAKKDKNINNVNESSKAIKDTFAEIGSLINELNASLGKTSTLTQDVGDNLSQSVDLSKEFMDSEVNVKNLKSKVASLDNDKLQKLQKALKTGKGLTHELTNELGIQGNIGKLAGAAGKEKLKALGIDQKSVALQSIKNKYLKAMNAAMDMFITQLFTVDKETTKMAKSLNLSKYEAINLKKNFAAIARDSGDIRINSVRLGKAQATLNSQLGTAQFFSAETLSTTSKLVDVVGLSAEAASQLAFQAQNSGQSLREVEENALGASYSMQRGAGVALNMKDILEATGKVSGQLRAQLGANPTEIAKAITSAKLLGIELDKLASAGKSLLNFESSIESELEAELLTGKELNLERARAAALAGDQVALAEELAKNVGTYGEFTKMNTLQQDALAKAMGMSSDEMENMLFAQETMNMNAEQLRAQGKGELADKLELLDAEERRNLAMEKFQTTIGDVAAAFLPVVEFLGKGFEYIAGMKAVLGPLVGVMTALATAAAMFAVKAGIAATKSMIKAAAETFGSFAKIPFGIGIPLAIGAVAAMYSMLSKPPKVKDGYAPSSRGPFTISDNYGAMARTTPGDNLQVGPGSGGGASAQPVVIQNNWDAFAASNGNGRRGLGGTQALQASPTFA